MGDIGDFPASFSRGELVSSIAFFSSDFMLMVDLIKSADITSGSSIGKLTNYEILHSKAPRVSK